MEHYTTPPLVSMIQLTDLITLQLLVNLLQSSFHAQPKVDFLNSSSTSRISRHLGHFLDFLDPAVNVTLQSIEEGWIWKECRIDSFNGNTLILLTTLYPIWVPKLDIFKYQHVPYRLPFEPQDEYWAKSRESQHFAANEANSTRVQPSSSWP